jgi:2'-5' RNA ligase
MRLFIAVELPEAVRDGLRQGLGRLRRDQPAARWVRPEGMHLTLKFIGEQSPALAEQLAALLPPALAGCAPVRVALGGGGFFPDARRPRVAWVGGEAPGLTEWAAATDRCATALGMPPEARPFSLHLTLARMERPWTPSVCEHFIAEVRRWSLPAFEAGEVVVFGSELKPSGAVHTPLHRITVGGGGAG